MRPLLISLLLLGPCACEESIRLEGTVVVPPDVQKKFTANQPGAVIVTGEIPGSSLPLRAVWVLCGPTDTAIEAPFDIDKFGCANEGTLRATVRPVTPDFGACGTHDGKITGTLGETILADGSAQVFKGKHGCGSGEAKGLRIVVTSK